MLVTRRTSRGWIKRAAVAVVLLATLVLTGQRIGERDFSEAGAIGTLRAITSAESTYAAFNGYYDTLDCLATTRSCVTGLGGQNPFLAPQVVLPREQRGYRIVFHPGPKAESRTGERRSPSAMAQFAVVAFPVSSGARQPRAFCADDRQLIYVITGGTMPRVEHGRCLETTNLLQR